MAYDISALRAAHAELTAEMVNDTAMDWGDVERCRAMIARLYGLLGGYPAEVTIVFRPGAVDIRTSDDRVTPFASGRNFELALGHALGALEQWVGELIAEIEAERGGTGVPALAAE